MPRMVTLATPAPGIATRPTPPAAAAPIVGPCDVSAATRPARASRFPAVTEGPARPVYFRTYEQVRDSMHQYAADHTSLVRIEDIGDSSEKVRGVADRDVLAMHVTSPTGGPNKPKLMMIAGVHSREIANPELVLRAVDDVVSAYGKDADATHLLDTRELVVVPMVNPDGHVVVEKAFAGVAGGNLWQRKNTAPQFGTDLNRNYPFHFGDHGANADPRSETYPGPKALSEPEAQAVVDAVTREKPGLFLDWHSRGNVVLYQYGHSDEVPKDIAAIKAVAGQLALRNGYDTSSSYDQSPTSATAKDWAYGALGIPAYTMETGVSFHQSDAEFADSWKRNRDVFRYAARIAPDPFKLGLAPAADAATVDAATGAVEARFRQRGGAGATGAIAAAELVLDPAAAPGSGIAMEAVDGRFDSADERVRAALPPAVANAADGDRKMLFVRARDAAGNWGPVTAQWATGAAPPAATAVR